MKSPSDQHTRKLDWLYIGMYKYSFAALDDRMPIGAPLASDRSAGQPARVTRVAVAGATGYAGQELVRLLARHPAVTLTAAMSSGATSTPRPMPALARIWDGEVVPLDVDRLARDADVVFLALPEAASAELAPQLLLTAHLLFPYDVEDRRLTSRFHRLAPLRLRQWPRTRLISIHESLTGYTYECINILLQFRTTEWP